MPPPGGNRHNASQIFASADAKLISIVICRDMCVTNYSLRGARVAAALRAARHEAQRNSFKKAAKPLF